MSDSHITVIAAIAVDAYGSVTVLDPEKHRGAFLDMLQRDGTTRRFEAHFAVDPKTGHATKVYTETRA